MFNKEGKFPPRGVREKRRWLAKGSEQKHKRKKNNRQPMTKEQDDNF